MARSGTDKSDRGGPVDVCIVGGAGHVGLPLGLVLADHGQSVVLYDVDQNALAAVASGQMPFTEYGAEPVLQRVHGDTLSLSSDMRDVARARLVIVAVGTPVDEYLNPKLRALLELFGELRPHLDPSQTIVIRSTVYPNTCRQVQEQLGRDGSGPWHVAYCPERIAQGHAIKELPALPQLVSGLTETAVSEARALFERIAPKIVEVTVGEAELAKLFTNAWRYIQFATANQFYMMAEDFGVDFTRVREAMVEGYERATSLPTAGLAAGPCLLKDTMQLAAFHSSSFQLGQAAMQVNEGLPGFIVDQLRRRHDLATTRVGILGMAFKADIDDIRDSLSYKLGKILRFHGADVCYSDEFVDDPTFIAKEELLATSDVVIVGVPHTAYVDLRVPASLEVVDPWNVVRQEGR